jgi:DNA ligase D-like protein (predicted ligase)
MLPTLADEPPAGDDWLHEIKHDGYRSQLHLEPGRSRAFTRNGHDWSHRYRLVLDCAEKLRRSAILDGEMIVQDEQGRSDFHALKSAIARAPERLVFYAFDLLALDGRDLRRVPLLDRRTELVMLVGPHDRASCVQFSDAVMGGGPLFFDQVAPLEMEGIVSKKANSRYASGRTKSWLKVKAFTEGEFVVVGWEPSNRGPAVALLARETSDGLAYAGGAFVTLANDERERFWRTMEQLVSNIPPVALPGQRSALWVRPELRVKAKFLKGEKMLRHATLCALVG